MNPSRFHVPRASSGALLVLPESAAHHARDVLRLRCGDELRVFDGHGHEFAALIEKTGRRQVWVRVLMPVETARESGLRIFLAVPPLKRDLTSLVVEKCTELGVSEIWPVFTARTDTDGRGRVALHGLRRRRWDRIASSAAEQCGRSVVPAILPICSIAEMLQRPFQGARLVCAEQGGSWTDRGSDSPHHSVLLLVGPAGGLTSEELTHARGAGFVPVTLGPRRLRSETAAIAAVALSQMLWGDLFSAG